MATLNGQLYGQNHINFLRKTDASSSNELGDGNPAIVSISSDGGVDTWPSIFSDELDEYPCRLLIRKLLEDGETAMSSLNGNFQ